MTIPDTGEDKAILASRAALYEEAKSKHPARWRGRDVRNWTPIGSVWPERVIGATYGAAFAAVVMRERRSACRLSRQQS